MSAIEMLPSIGELDTAQLAVQGDPAWLAERRAAAWQIYADSAAPEWRRSNLRALDLPALQPLRGTAQTALSSTSAAGV